MCSNFYRILFDGGGEQISRADEIESVNTIEIQNDVAPALVTLLSASEIEKLEELYFIHVENATSPRVVTVDSTVDTDTQKVEGYISILEEYFGDDSKKMIMEEPFTETVALYEDTDESRSVITVPTSQSSLLGYITISGVQHYGPWWAYLTVKADFTYGYTWDNSTGNVLCNGSSFTYKDSETNRSRSSVTRTSYDPNNYKDKIRYEVSRANSHYLGGYENVIDGGYIQGNTKYGVFPRMDSWSLKGTFKADILPLGVYSFSARRK